MGNPVYFVQNDQAWLRANILSGCRGVARLIRILMLTKDVQQLKHQLASKTSLKMFGPCFVKVCLLLLSRLILCALSKHRMT